MSCTTFKSSVGFPVFGLAFTASNQLIVCGGGGAGRSGVKNKLSSYKVDARRKDLEEDASFEFGLGEDAPMCLDVHPTKPFAVTSVNSSQTEMEQGINDNCRHFNIGSDKFTLEKAIKTLSSKMIEDYQRVVRFSQDGSVVATGTTDGKVNVFKYPEFESIATIEVSMDDEVLDLDINLEKEKLTCITRDELKLINLRGKNVGQVVQTISTASVVKNVNTNFRAFRYGRGFTNEFAFAVVNGTTKPGSYLVKYDAYTLEQIKFKQVSTKPVTAFTLSQDGALVAIACADLSITLMDAQSFAVLYKLKDAHSFSITTLAISPDRRLLASASADNTVRIINLPLQFTSSLNLNPLHTLLLAVVVSVVLLWLTTLVDLEPYLRPQKELIEVTSTVALAETHTTMALTPTVADIIAETYIIAETPTAGHQEIRDEL